MIPRDQRSGLEAGDRPEGRQVPKTGDRDAERERSYLPSWAKIAPLMRRAALLAAYFAVMLAIRYAGWLMDDYKFFLNPAREVYGGTLDTNPSI